MKYALIAIMLFGFSARAALVEDVEILEIQTLENKNIEVKLRSQHSPATSYFFVELYQDSKKTAADYRILLLKSANRAAYKLDLDIASFSPYPNGSVYSNDSVRFYGRMLREPSQSSRKNQESRTSPAAKGK